MKEQLRLFVIEDDDDIALLIQSSLERAGHQVTRCRTAADALIVLEHDNHDVIILDQRLPDMEGMDLVKLFAKENVSLPIVMVTAYGDEELATNALQAGVLDYVVKDPELTFLTALPKRAEECAEKHELRQLNELLIHSLESTGDGIMITDLRGTILHVNQALIKMTGYQRDELIGRQPRLLKSGTHAAETYAEIWQTIRARQSWQGELTNRRKDGTLYETSQTISPVIDAQGRLTHFVGSARDVTEHKQLQRQFLQAHKMQSVGTLAGGVAHEFNNILAGINGYAALGLRESDVTPEIRELLQHVEDLSLRAAGLTGQLLAFARQPSLVRQPTSMEELLQGTAQLVERTLHVAVQLEVPAALDGGEPLVVDADWNQLQQAIVNLALNSRDALREKFEQQGDTSDEAKAEQVVFRLCDAHLTEEKPGFPQVVPMGSYVVVEVLDTGCGMAADVLQQSVDPFFTTKDVGQGTGLGLSVVFGIVQGHQGFLTVESQLGEGTRMSLWLPRHHAPRPPQPVADRTDDSARVIGSDSVAGRSILVVDDEEAVLTVVRRFLEIAGHNVHCATSGQAALEWMGTAPQLDLVILDLFMPRENALSNFQRIRERYPNLPVLICTGNVSNEKSNQLVAAGALGPLRKPFRMNELWSAVDQALQS